MRRTFYSRGKSLCFELWKNGTGFSEIANITGSKPGNDLHYVRDTGGIKPHERKRVVAHPDTVRARGDTSWFVSQNEHSCDSYCAESQSFDDLT